MKAILDLKSNYYVSTNVERVTFVFRIFKQEPEAPVTLPILDTRPEIEEKKKERENINLKDIIYLYLKQWIIENSVKS